GIPVVAVDCLAHALSVLVADVVGRARVGVVARGSGRWIVRAPVGAAGICGEIGRAACGDCVAHALSVLVADVVGRARVGVVARGSGRWIVRACVGAAGVRGAGIPVVAVDCLAHALTVLVADVVGRARVGVVARGSGRWIVRAPVGAAGICG